MNSKSGYIKYVMSETMAKNFLKDRKGRELRMNPNEYLCAVVNETFGLKGYCVEVVVK